MTGRLIGRLAVFLTRLAHRYGTHRYLSTGCLHSYLSTGCLHSEHAYCQGKIGRVGAKKPGVCKFCEAKCICPCHRPATPDA